MFRFVVKGVVQGVGFRPFVYRECVNAGLKGYVQNTGSGVVIVSDDREKLEEILKHLPPLASIDSIEVDEIEGDFSDFSIVQSSGKGYAEVPPDLYLCEDCFRELNDSGDRRYGYFFITCTNCGPRFSMTENSPYDRPMTSMSDFQMCERCKKEYENPSDRRYHAQTIACHDCGPKINLFSDGLDAGGIKEAAELIKRGEIVAIKGVGGFHLASNIEPGTLSKLREFTGRPNKPYAIMVKDLEMLDEIAEYDDEQKRLLTSIERPIVLLKKKKALEGVSELDTVGVMLPYTALHYLLFDFINQPLVMTSANMPDNPITTEKNQQFVKHVLSHDRRIVNPVDDSVIKAIGGKKLLLRRSRGFVPKSIQLPKDCRDMLALGAEMNSTFCVVKGGRATLSQFLGNTANQDAFEQYKKTIEQFLNMTKCRPELIVCDFHPSYNTSIYAQSLSNKLGVPLVKVQHHLAHAYSVVAEHDIHDFTAIVCDGLGYGSDGNIWGGEVFVNDKRVGHLEEQYLIGGDSATIHPAKFLYSVLSRFLDASELNGVMSGFFSSQELGLLSKQLEQRFNCPVTTSCARVLDAAAVLLGLCKERTYDGRPAMLLESFSTEPYELAPVIEGDVLMTTPIFKFLVENMEKDKGRLAATVQQYLAEGLFSIASRHGKQVVFSGGCAYNEIMTSYMLEQGVFVNEQVPCGDGGISFGQVAYCSANPRHDIA